MPDGKTTVLLSSVSKIISIEKNTNLVTRFLATRAAKSLN